jgi:O-antigen/teichoic acid export membrane protein
MAYVRGNYFFLHAADPIVMGQYAAADRLVLRPLLGVAAAFFVSSLPTVARVAEERDFEKLRAMFLRSAGRIVAVMVAVVAVAWPSSAWVLARFAPEYAGAVWPFRILLVGACFMFVGQLARTYVAALGKYRTMMAFAGANLGVFVAVAWLLVPAHGGVGAALATTITEGVGATSLLVLVMTIFSRHRGTGVMPARESPVPASSPVSAARPDAALS